MYMFQLLTNVLQMKGYGLLASYLQQTSGRAQGKESIFKVVKTLQKSFSSEDWKQIKKYHKIQAKLIKDSAANSASINNDKQPLFKAKNKFSISSCTRSIASKKSNKTMDNHELAKNIEQASTIADPKKLGHFDDLG